MTYTCLGKKAVEASEVTVISSTPSVDSQHSAINAVGTGGTSYTSNPSGNEVVLSLGIQSNLFFLVTMINYEVTNAGSLTITLYSNSQQVWTSSEFTVSKTIRGRKSMEILRMVLMEVHRFW